MQDKNVLITGGTDGMGMATAQQFAKKGARLLLVGRNREKGETAVTQIIHTSGNNNIAFIQADLSLMSEMRRLIESVRQICDRLDVLVHGAGGRFPQQRVLTDEGLEMTFAVQYLARYLLTNELLDLLSAAPTPQVLSIAGGATGSKKVEFDNLNGDKSYGKFAAIGKAGATNYLLTLAQTARYRDITFYNYGPGIVRTATTTQNLPIMRLLYNTLGRPFTRSPEQAAGDIMRLLTGNYPGGFYGVSLKRQEPIAEESDTAISEKLWKYSEKLVADVLDAAIHASG